MAEHRPQQARPLGDTAWPYAAYPLTAYPVPAEFPPPAYPRAMSAGAEGFSQTPPAAGYQPGECLPAGSSQLGLVGDESPLRVIHVGNYMVRAGIESWLKALLRYTNPRRVQFKRCVVTSPLSDPRVMREMPAPVEVGQEASVRRAAQDCDVLLISGPAEVADWISPHRPPLCVFVAHGDGIWSRNILERCSPVVDHVVAVSQHAQNKVCHGFPSTVIYNGIDNLHLSRASHREAVRARFGFAPDDFVVGSVMRLSSEKRPELLVEAMARLPRRFKLFLVGWGAAQQQLLQLANEIAPLRCVIAPAAENLGDYYSAFDAFCLPSESEGFGLATLEALFCGVPVITTKTGFAPELLVNQVHYLQVEGNSASIVAAVELLARHPQWAAGLAREGRQAAEHFGFATRMCREYEDLLVRLWRQRSPRGPV